MEDDNFEIEEARILRASYRNIAKLANTDMRNIVTNPTMKLSTYLPYAGSVIIFLGVVRLVMYYHNFSISIVNYLEFSEIITSFLDVLVVCAFFLLYVVSEWLFRSDKSEDTRKSREKARLLKADSFIEIIKVYPAYLQTRLLILITFALLIVAADIFGLCTTPTDRRFFFSIAGLALAWPILQVEIERKRIKIGFGDEFQKLSSLILIGALFFLIVEIVANYEAGQVIEDNFYSGTVIEFTDGKIFQSTHNRYYVGNTQNYVFIFDERKGLTDVVPMEYVRKLTFHKH